MQREIGKCYVYSMKNGLLIREATAEETARYETLNADRKYKLVPCSDGEAIDKFHGEPQQAY